MDQNMAQNAAQDQEKKRYITRLMDAKCSLGSMTNKLNLPLDHGIIFHEMDFPLMNANDFKSDQHIVHFGRCTSNVNPKNYVSLESLILPFAKGVKSLIGCDGCKCKPKILSPWVFTNDTHFIGGAPALTLKSENTCFYGGQITITLEVEAAREEAGEENQEEVPEEKNILDTLPASMQDQIGDFMERYQETAEAGTLEQLAQNAAAVAAQIALGMLGGGGAAGGGINQPSSGLPAGGQGGGVFPGMAGFGMTPAVSADNFSRNLYQSIPFEALDERGNIADSSLLSNFNIGYTTLAYADCGCSAIYNMLNGIGQTPDLAGIIRHCEEYAISKAMPLGGALATAAMNIIDYFESGGYQPEVAVVNRLPAVGQLSGGHTMVGRLAANSLTASFQMAAPESLPEPGGGPNIMLSLSGPTD